MSSEIQCLPCLGTISTEGATPYLRNFYPVDEQDEQIVQLSCNHFFHLRCIHQWLNTYVENSRPGRLHNTCPTCRRVVVIHPPQLFVEDGSRELAASPNLFLSNFRFAIRETYLLAMLVMTAILVPAIPSLISPLIFHAGLLGTGYAIAKSLDWITGHDSELYAIVAHYIKKISVFLLCTLYSPLVVTFLTTIKIIGLVIVQPYGRNRANIEPINFYYNVDSHCKAVIRRIADYLIN